MKKIGVWITTIQAGTHIDEFRVPQQRRKCLGLFDSHLDRSRVSFKRLGKAAQFGLVASGNRGHCSRVDARQTSCQLIDNATPDWLAVPDVLQNDAHCIELSVFFVFKYLLFDLKA